MASRLLSFQSSPVMSASLLALACCGHSAHAQGCANTLENLGNLGGTSTSPKATTGDCRVVVGVSQTPGSEVARGFYWRENEGISQIPPLLNEPFARTVPTAVSFDGSVVVGWGDFGGPVAFRYDRAANTTTMLPDPGGAAGYVATAISDNGNIIFGINNTSDSLGGAASWAYTASGGYSFLSQPGQMPNFSYVAAVSAQDQLQDIVVVGTGFHFTPETGGLFVAMRWSQSSGFVPVVGLVPSSANDVSNDGTVIVGTMQDPNDPDRWLTYRWKQGAGVTILGGGLGFGAGRSVVVSGDGSQVVFLGVPGQNEPFTTLRIVSWTESTGIDDLGPYLGSTTTSLESAQFLAGVSDLGTKLVGTLAVDQANRTRFDTDQDGLPDSWECLGVPYVDENGVPQRYLLDFDGDGNSDADPRHKDMFVEVDAMQGQGLSSFAIDLVTNAFADAPLTNPDGTTGVRLHTHVNETDLPLIAEWQTASPSECWPSLPVSFESYREAFFATPADRVSAARVQARARAVRYTIIGAANARNFGGCGELPGDNSVVYALEYDSDFDIATAWMHELGHNLNLGHGGHDNINGKPNYPSIMNYAYGYQSPWNEEFWMLDFSRANSSPTTMLRDIHESCTHEDQPIGPAAGRYASTYMAYSTEVIVNGAPTRTVGYISLGGGIADFNSNGALDPCTAADLNFLNVPSGISLPSTPSPGQTLQSNDDWAIVAQNLAPQAARGAAAAAPSYPADEPTSDSIAWIRANFPPPPGSGPTCDAIDFNNDTGFFDPQDIDAFLSVYSEGPCVPETATCNDIDFNNDGALFDPCDIESFLLVFSEGPCTACGV